MKNKYKLLTGALLIGTLLTTGCTSQKVKTPEKKPMKINKINKSSATSTKEAIDKNMKLRNKVCKTQTEIDKLDKKIAETPLGKKRAELVKKKVSLEEKIKEIKSQQIENAKISQQSRQTNH